MIVRCEKLRAFVIILIVLASSVYAEKRVLWSWGFGLYGRLGLGDDTDRVVPALLEGFEKVSRVSAGGYHSLLLAGNGSVFSWGLSPASGPSTFSTPRRVHSLPDCNAGISAGTYHSLVVSCNEEVWSWGKCADGRLGDNQQLVDRTEPVKINLTGVVEVSAGSRHSLARTNDGRVYSWGYGGDGALGSGDTNTVLTPLEVDFLRGENVTRVEAGATHSLAISTNSEGENDVWFWGNSYNLSSLVPIRVNVSNCSDCRVVDISAGQSYSLLRTEDGRLYSWGGGSEGQLGLGPTINTTEPTEIHLGNCHAVGMAAGSGCSVALCSVNNTVHVRTWGSGACLGRGAADMTVRVPHEVSSPPHNLSLGIQVDVWRHAMMIGVEMIPPVPLSDLLCQTPPFVDKKEYWSRPIGDVGETYLTLHWRAPLCQDDVIEYLIMYRNSGGDTDSVRVSVSNTSYSHLVEQVYQTTDGLRYRILGLSPGEEYYFKISARTVDKVGPFTNESSLIGTASLSQIPNDREMFMHALLTAGSTALRGYISDVEPRPKTSSLHKIFISTSPPATLVS